MGIGGVEQSAADEPEQHTSADAGLDRGDIGLAEGGQLADAKLTLVEVEQCVDDTAVEAARAKASTELAQLENDLRRTLASANARADGAAPQR